MANYQWSLGLFLHLWYITNVSLWHNPVINHAYRTQTHLQQQVPRSTNWVLKRECLPRIGWISQQRLPVAFAGDEMKDSRKWSNSSINIYQPLNHVWFLFYCNVPESVAGAHGPRCAFGSLRRIGQWNRNWYNALRVPSCRNQMAFLLARS